MLLRLAQRWRSAAESCSRHDRMPNSCQRDLWCPPMESITFKAGTSGGTRLTWEVVLRHVLVDFVSTMVPSSNQNGVHLIFPQPFLQMLPTVPSRHTTNTIRRPQVDNLKAADTIFASYHGQASRLWSKGTASVHGETLSLHGGAAGLYTISHRLANELLARDYRASTQIPLLLLGRGLRAPHTNPRPDHPGRFLPLRRPRKTL